MKVVTATKIITTLGALLALGGCPDTTSPGPDGGSITVEDDGGDCGRCAQCRGEQRCVGGGSTAWRPLCLPSCETTDDCTAGQRCVSFAISAAPGAGSSPAVCLGDRALSPCPGTPAPSCPAPPGPARCFDDILHRPITILASPGAACAVEHVRCPRGCAPITGDAGTSTDCL